MAESRKYYYMRLKEDFFDSDEMVVLESIPDGVIYQNILLKMYCRSLKSNGRLMLNGVIPYNPQMLAGITRQQVGTVEKALEIFKNLGLIEILDNGAIYMMNIQNYIGQSSSEADRIREYREQISTEKQEICTNVQQTYTRDRDIERDKDKTITKDKDTLGKNAERIVALFNEICPSLQKVIKVSDARKKTIATITKAFSDEEIKTVFEKAEKSDFLTGKTKPGFKAAFDWIMKQSNFIKVLEGNYDNYEKPQQESPKKELTPEQQEWDELLGMFSS